AAPEMHHHHHHEFMSGLNDIFEAQKIEWHEGSAGGSGENLYFQGDQKKEYYHGSFKILDPQINNNFGQSNTYQLKDLRETTENLVDEIFIDSAWKKNYIKNQVVRLTPEEDGVKVDVIMVFQFPSTEQRAVREKKIQSILNQKIRNLRALPINASSVQVNAMSSSTGELTVQASCGKRVVPLNVNR
uniref:Transmembrane protease serine 11A n=1 Tax=Homo sapiens TaxID=9606 RepID=UPI003D81C6AA